MNKYLKLLLVALLSFVGITSLSSCEENPNEDKTSQNSSITNKPSEDTTVTSALEEAKKLFKDCQNYKVKSIIPDNMGSAYKDSVLIREGNKAELEGGSLFVEETNINFIFYEKEGDTYSKRVLDKTMRFFDSFHEGIKYINNYNFVESESGIYLYDSVDHKNQYGYTIRLTIKNNGVYLVEAFLEIDGKETDKYVWEYSNIGNNKVNLPEIK